MDSGAAHMHEEEPAAEHVVILTPIFPPAFRGGGPIRTMDALVRTAPQHLAVAVVTGDRDVGTTSTLAVDRNCWTTWEGVPCYYATARSISGLLGLQKAVTTRRPGILYINSFFSRPFSMIPLLLRRFGWCKGAALLLAPRGEFSTGALTIKARRKKAYIAVYRWLGLHRGVVWHASSSQELQQIRSLFGGGATVLVREDETSLPPDPVPPKMSTAGALRVVFLGRIAAIKGLDVLLNALTMTAATIELVVHGPENDRKYLRLCKNLCSELPPGVTVRFGGPIDSDDVRGVLMNYDLMALPTAGENFGHAIAEALSVSCPVMCTDRTPWTALLRSGGGVIVEARTPTAWAAALEAYAGLSAEQRLARRRDSGLAYVAWQKSDKGPHIFDLLRHRAAEPHRGPALRDETASAEG